MGEVDPRVKAMLEKAELKYKTDTDGDFILSMGLPDDRSQSVLVRSQTHRIGGHERREILSVVHQGDMPEPKVMAYCLRQNYLVHFGSWRLQVDEENQRAVLLFGLDLDANASPEDLKFMISIVAKTADDLEQKLSNEDNF